MPHALASCGLTRPRQGLTHANLRRGQATHYDQQHDENQLGQSRATYEPFFNNRTNASQRTPNENTLAIFNGQGGNPFNPLLLVIAIVTLSCPLKGKKGLRLRVRE